MENLPYKVKELLMRERDFHNFSLTATVAEARRQSNVNLFLNKGAKFQSNESRPQQSANKPQYNNKGGGGGYKL